MRPCREPRGSGLLSWRTTVSDNRPQGLMQMDTARYRRFSGTRQRQGLRMNSRPLRFASLPKSRWVNDAGPLTHTRKEKIGARTQMSSSAMGVRTCQQVVWTVTTNSRVKNATKNSYNLLTGYSNGCPHLLEVWAIIAERYSTNSYAPMSAQGGPSPILRTRSISILDCP